jgi:catechol-2,3-dioxygenase
MKVKLETIIIFVQNVDKLKTFYVDILKLEVIEEAKSQWLLLKAGACSIGLHKIGEQYLGADQKEFKFDNNTKIVFEVDEDLHTIREQLIQKDVALKEIMNWDSDYWLCDGEDPEGNIFQLRQKRA